MYKLNTLQEKRLFLKQKTLYITEIFASIQGETPLSGLPTLFIRLSGCNLRCSWCDTTYSFARGHPTSSDDIIQTAHDKGLKNICITGGEPLLQEGVFSLMSELCDQGYVVNLETGGSLPIDTVDPRVLIVLDIKCPKSLMAEKNHLPNIEKLKDGDIVKFVIQDRVDFDFANTFCLTHGLYDSPIECLFSPVHDILDPKTLVAWILEDKIPVRLNLQLHKYIWSPTTIGV